MKEILIPRLHEDRAFDTESSILFTTVQDLMPYGDGSNKVFGYENFEATYILQLRSNALQHTEFKV